MAENLLTVAALRTVVEADLIRGKLESAGITAVLLEPEKTAEGTPAGRVQVQVGPSDFERAMQLLFPIPQAKPAAKTDKPPWNCPKCGEQVMDPFPACWSCGTPREGTSQSSATQGGPPGISMPAAGLTTPASLPRMPIPTPIPSMPIPSMPIPSMPIPSMPIPSMPVPPSAAAPLPVSPRISPPAPPLARGLPPSGSTRNGESRSKGLSLPPLRPVRTAEDESLKITVPPWDGAKASSGRSGGKSTNPTEADDRAARRAWWAAVIGLALWPVLLYSIGIVLVLGLSNRPLSSRGNRFFYGALAINALFIAAAFILLGTRQ
jgi:hypothetical protein